MIKERHWVIRVPGHTYQLSFRKKYASYVVLDGRRVDIRKAGYDVDFQLPIDEAEVWCRYGHHGYFDVYADGVLIPDEEGSTPPRMPLEQYRSLAGVMAMVCLILWIVFEAWSLLRIVHG